MHKETIGSCTLYLGDCHEILPEVGEFDLLLTDPPYDIKAGNGGGVFGQRDHLVKTGGFTDGGVDYSFLKGVRNWFCFCSFKQLPELLSIASEKERFELLTWNKPNPVPTCNNKYLPDVEYIVHGFSKGCLWGGYNDKSHFIVWPCGNKKTDHPNEKPLPVIDRLLSAGTNGGVVCDSFMGSGTTGVACAKRGLPFIGIEIDEKYFEMSCERVEEAIRTRPRLFDGSSKKDPVQGKLFC